jgi:lysophospholipase L1-like esterase
MAEAVLLKESLGAKLRRLAASVAVLKLAQSFTTHPPLLAPAAWAPNSPVETGQVRAANGNWYVCGKSGTTAGAGTGPSAAATSALIVDGGTLWAFLCKAPIVRSSPLAPTISRQVAPVPTGLDNYYNCVALPGAFRVSGGFPQPYFSNYWKLCTFSPSAAGPSGVSTRVDFVTDAARFAIGVSNGSGTIRILIDGQYVDAGGLAFSKGGTPTWLILDFSASTGRAIRSVTLEFGFDQTFAGVAVSPTDSVWAPGAPDTVRCAFISDSLGSSSAFGPFLPGGDAPSRMSAMLGWDDCWNCSVGGTGYVASGNGQYTFGQRIPEMLTRKPDIWVFMGSVNDIASSPQAVQAAALKTFQSVREGGSQAPIVVFGIWSIRNFGLAAVEAAIQAAVTQFADPLRQTFFIPIFGDPVLSWITGDWNNARNSKSANAGEYIGSDGIHPTETGTWFEAVRLANAISTHVLPNIP